MTAKGSAPKPDPAIGQAAMQQAKLGADYLEIVKGHLAEQSTLQKSIAEQSAEVSAFQLQTAKTAQEWSNSDRDRYEKTILPLQDKFIAEAEAYGSEASQADAAAKARADVLNAASGAAASRGRTMASMGISPTSGRYAGIERASDRDLALAVAGAQNQARETAKGKGLALTADAINMGRGLPSQAAAGAGLGISAGSTSIGTAATPIGLGNQSMGVLQSGYGTAMGGYQGQANTLNQLYGSELAGWQAQQQAGAAAFSGLGSLVGAAIPLMSSKDVKTDKQPAKGVLAAVRKMPVEEWTYKEGVADGGRHIGPYAEDFHAATGKGDGKVIPIVDAIGVTLGAIRELDQKVEKLGKKKKAA